MHPDLNWHGQEIADNGSRSPTLRVVGQIARRLDTTEGAVQVTVHRLRRRYGEMVRTVVSQTVNNPMDVENELAHLMAALRG